MKTSLILTILGAILIVLSIAIQLVISEPILFVILFVIGIILCVLCFNYFILVDLNFLSKSLEILRSLSSGIDKETNKKEIRHCPNCGRPIPIDARICPYCTKNFEQ